MKNLRKNSLLVVLIAILFPILCLSLEAQNKTPLKAITINPIAMFNEERFVVKYEQMLNKTNSFTVEVGFDNNYNDALVILLGGTYRWYFHKIFPDINVKRLEGLSLAPVAFVNFISYDTKVDKETYLGLDFGGEVNYKFIFGGMYVVEPSIRFIYQTSGFKRYNEGFRVWPGVSLGFAF